MTLIGGRHAAEHRSAPTTAIPMPGYGFYEETGDDTISSLDMTGGCLTITGTLTVTGAMTWTDGYIVGPGTLIVEGGLSWGRESAISSRCLTA